ncbi:MAG TPA: hypothetical protein VF476_11055 [Chitinophagaceae bacterium]
MNNAYAMSATLETRKNSQATMITAGFTAFMIVLMFVLKWKLPVFEAPITEAAIEVELNLPPEEPQASLGGGGGGGNPVQANGPEGTASAPPNPGEKEEARDIDEDNDKAAPEVLKPVVVKPTATKINNNTSTVKTPPKPIIENPAPAKPKAVLGKTVSGSNTGGGAADNYDRTGGAGNGAGVGTGNGTGGGRGNGSGGGNGPGLGTGSGPRRVSGSHYVINPKPMNAGENIEGRINAEIRISPDGVGTFVRGTGGALMSNRQAIEIVRDWLRKNRFNATDGGGTVVYEFNIKMGG